MVDAETEQDDFNYNKVDKKLLPKELQQKTNKELEAYVSKKKVERIKIQKQIQEENSKRTKFIAEEKKKNNINNHLENAMLNAIKKQGKQKNYHWNK